MLFNDSKMMSRKAPRPSLEAVSLGTAQICIALCGDTHTAGDTDSKTIVLRLILLKISLVAVEVFYMIIESILIQLFGLLSLDTLFSDNSSSLSEYIGAFSDILTYFDYLDPIIPVRTCLTCAGVILLWTITCCIFKFLVEVLKVAFK